MVERLSVAANQVVEGSQVIGVFFSDGTKQTATLLGTDSFADLALAKVDGNDHEMDSGHPPRNYLVHDEAGDELSTEVYRASGNKSITLKQTLVVILDNT